MEKLNNSGILATNTISWESYQEWVLYERKLSGKKNALTALKSRFKELAGYFNGKELTRPEFTAFIAQKKQSGSANSTLNKYIGLIKNIARYEKVSGFEDITYFKEPRKKDVDPLSWQEISGIASLCVPYKTNRQGEDSETQNIRMQCIFRLLGETGCRVSEAVELLWKDVDGRVLTFRDTKNSEDRQVLISGDLSRIIQTLPKKTKAVFGLNDYHWISFDLKRRATKLGILKPVYPHIIRHSVVTNLLKEGAKIEIVQEMVGHKDINTTIRYTHNKLSDFENMLSAYSGLWKESLTLKDVAQRGREYLSKLVIPEKFSFQELLKEIDRL